jgi:4-hydroxyphenylpyruvate dioxygenase-like putative hemolysin
MGQHEDFMPLDGWDHVELWVGNAKQAAYWYEHALGFRRIAYAGPETGVRDRASYVLQQGDIRIAVSSGLRRDSPVGEFACIHGDGVKDISLRVPDAREAYRQAVQRGARGIVEPHWAEDEFGRVELSTIATYGDVVHTFVNRSDYEGAFLPGYRAEQSTNGAESGVGLLAVEEYLEFNHGPGVQHVALTSSNIVKTVEALQRRGVVFLATPHTYYEDVADRVGEIEEDYADLQRLGILADRDEDGYLLQIFTKTAQDRPTLFFEVIERHGARGFGDGNFKALFEAIEREQALRGNL